MNENEQGFYRIFSKFLPALIFFVLGVGAIIFLLSMSYIDLVGTFQIMGIVTVAAFLLIGITAWRLSRRMKEKDR